MADSNPAAQPTPSVGGRRLGVSLIEVLVVLVILVVGILVIIRLYPSGFFSVQSVGNAAVADSLGTAALQAAGQDVGGLPDAIIPVGTNATFPGGMDAYGRPVASAGDGAYDPAFNAAQQPDYSQTLNQARLVVNETITVPPASAAPAGTGNARQSVHVVKFSPIVTPATPTPGYLSVNSTFWQPVMGNAAAPPPTQDVSYESKPQFSVDLAGQRIAVPYAAYDSAGNSYAQEMVVSITGSDYKTYTEYLNIPAGTPRGGTGGVPAAPYQPDGRNFLPDTASNYQGGWFDPTATYGNSGAGALVTLPPSVSWLSVSLYRPYAGLGLTAAFSPTDPYQFKLASANIDATHNLGGLAFNPLAGGGAGTDALKARLSYQVADWKVIHEDRDVPALSGINTAALRLSLKNLKRAGDEGPNNTIYNGLLGSGKSMYVLDLDTGRTVAPGSTTDPSYDPTITDFPLVDEDLNGTQAASNLINVSFATGRVTFGSNAFGDNPSGSTPHAHRVRIFYAGDLDWTVAVQKAASYYAFDGAIPAGSTSVSILPGHCAYDPATGSLLFPQMDAGKTVEVDGPPSLPGQTQAIGDIVNSAYGTNYVSLLLPPGTFTAANITAVRGLSARAVVAWQERGQWKSHSVDTLLSRTP